ncbi:MAG: metallophosphoesterase [Clostridia bacterium]|nr:metallophosphoesterase [Clostridia bacterium]
MIVLNKKTDENFKILHVTDLHILPNEWKEGHEVRNSVIKTVNELVDRVKPDLITHGGDFSSAKYPECYTKFASFLDSFGIPWTTVWGNHDNDCGEKVTRDYAEQFMECKNFVYEHGPEALGNGNFVIGIRQNGKIIHSLIMMDSHNRLEYTDNKGDTIKVYAKLTDEQLAWYGERMDELEKAGCKESTLMCHIPIYGFKYAFVKVYNYMYDYPKNIKYKDSIHGECWYEGYRNDAFGVRYEGECSYPEDDGVFRILKDYGSTKLVVCGHDHVNCTCVKYDGITLLYGLKTGRGSYCDESLNGGSVIEIDGDGKTHVRHEFVEL